MQSDIKCSICLNSYAVKDPVRPHGARIPLLLACGHTFCEGCLSKLATQHKSAIACPTCHKDIALKQEGCVRHLLPNLYYLGLLSAGRMPGSPLKNSILTASTQNGPLMTNGTSLIQEVCEECSRHQAVCRCNKCEMNMCHSCFTKVHSEGSSKAMRKHKPSPLTQEESVEESVMCVEHPTRTLEYYCQEDDANICCDCIIKGSHKGHAVTDLQTKEADALSELPAAVEKASLVARHLNHSAHSIPHTMQRIHNSYQHVANHVHQQFQLLHSKLQAREEILMGDLQKAAEDTTAPIHTQRVNAADQKTKLMKAVRGAQKLIGGGECGRSQALLGVLKAANEVPCVVIEQEDPPRPVHCSFDEELIKLVDECGKLEVESPSGLTMKCLDDVPEEMRQLPPEETRSTTPDSILTESVDRTSDSETASVISDISSSCTGSSRRGNHLGGRSHHQYKLGQHVPVYVTHAKNPCSFYVVTDTNMSRLTKLSKSITEFCSQAAHSSNVPSSVNVDDVVFAQYDVDQQWYRARVTNVLPGSDVELVYIDYGNPDSVHMSKLLLMPARFSKHAPLTDHCTLVDLVPSGETGQWSLEASKTFRKVHGDKPMIMTVLGEGEDGILQVDLCKGPNTDISNDGPVSVRDLMVFLELACFSSPLSRPNLHTGRPPGPVRRFLSRALPSPGQTVSACISHINSPHSFYIQVIGDDSQYLTELMEELQKVYGADKKDLYGVFCPTKDLVCAAQYSGDGFWYRAQVVALPGRRVVEVRYIDFGNSEMIPHWNLKKLKDNFLLLPIQGVHCELADVCAVDSEGWGPPATALLTKYQTSPLNVHIKGVSDDGTLSVVLTDPNYSPVVNINQELVSEGLAHSTVPPMDDCQRPPAPCLPTPKLSGAGDRKSPSIIAPDSLNVNVNAPEVSVSHIENPGLFYVHSTRQDVMEEYNSLTERLHDAYSRRTPKERSTWAAGENCVIQDSDKQWYRACVKEVTDNKVKILLVDVGRTDIFPACSLYPMDSEFKKHSIFAMPCRLVDIQPAGDVSKWSHTASETMRELVADQTCCIVDKGSANQGTMPVDLLLKKTVKGDALTPDTLSYESVASLLKDEGVALALRPKRATPPPREKTPTQTVPVAMETVPANQEAAWEGFPTWETPTSERMMVVPSYIDMRGVIYAQEYKEDSDKEGRLGILLHEHTLEVIAQDQYLASMGLHRGLIPRDGNCLFRAIAQALCGDQDDHTKIRQTVVEALRKNKSFCEKLDIGDEEYFDVMSLDGTYGGEPEILTVTDVYGVCVDVFMGGLNSNITHHTYGNTDSTHVHLVYLADGHYDAGHYDLALTSWEEVERTQAVYDEWRSQHASQLLQSQPSDPTCFGVALLNQVMTCLQVYDESPPEPETTWQVGQHVVAQFSEDKHFYRARITQKHPKGYEVHYLDFGNSEVVSADSLRTATVLKDVPQQCMDCCLHGIRPATEDGCWPIKVIEMIHSLIVGKSCTLYVKERPVPGEKLQIDLVLPDNRDIADILVRQELAVLTDGRLPPAPSTPSECSPHYAPSPFRVTPPTTQSSALFAAPATNYSPAKQSSGHSLLSNHEEHSPSTKVIGPSLQPMSVPDLGGVMDILVTSVTKPNMVYVQHVKLEDADTPHLLTINRDLDRLVLITQTLTEGATSLTPLTHASPGMVCTAQFMADGCWYRARIVSVDELDNALVIFVDYGNIQVTPVDSLRALPASCCDISEQSCLCRLVDIAIPPGDWSPDALPLMRALMEGKPFTAVVKGGDGSVPGVSLFDADKFASSGVDAPLLYQEYINSGILY